MIKSTFSNFSKKWVLGQKNSNFCKKLWFSSSLCSVRVGITSNRVPHDEPCWFQEKRVIFWISGQLAMASFITRHGEWSSANPEIHAYSPWRALLLGRRVVAEFEIFCLKTMLWTCYCSSFHSILLFNCSIVSCMDFLIVLQAWHQKDRLTLENEK